MLIRQILLTRIFLHAIRKLHFVAFMPFSKIYFTKTLASSVVYLYIFSEIYFILSISQFLNSFKTFYSVSKEYQRWDVFKFVLFSNSLLATAEDIAWANTKSNIFGLTRLIWSWPNQISLNYLFLVVEFQYGKWDVENTKIGLKSKFKIIFFDWFSECGRKARLKSEMESDSISIYFWSA